MPTSYIERGQPIDPHLRRWMLFVDGENLTMSAQRFAEEESLVLSEGSSYSRDVFVWLPRLVATRALPSMEDMFLPLQQHAIRAYYYTSVQGDVPRVESVVDALWDRAFTPRVFKKSKTRGSKAVDIALTTDMLSHAFRHNYDVALLYAGDGDCVPLVEEVKRLGKVVYLAFFNTKDLHVELRRASDGFLVFDDAFRDGWRKYPGG